ncbi:MAG: cation-translocating P-type ATPase [Alkalispirochaeta sp.]
MKRFLRALTRRGAETVSLSALLIASALVWGWLSPISGGANVLMIAAAVVAGIPVALTAVRAVISRQITIDLLVTIAAVGAVIIGEYWEAAAVTLLFDLGGYLEARTMARTRRVIGELLDLSPAQATVVRDGVEVTVDAAEVASGETAIVRPGSRIPVDGLVSGGESRVDESSITGESYPARKERESRVYAGTYNQSGLLRILVDRVGADTTLARIIARVEEAQESKAPTQRFIERFARWYTPAIILLAVGAYVLTGEVAFALTILVIGCPGALVISTPVSVVAGIGGAARQGILMKGGAHLEESGRITAVALDKTGTLTTGRPEVVRVVPAAVAVPAGAPVRGAVSFPAAVPVGVAGTHGASATSGASASGAATTADDVLWWAAAAERGSDHPLAGAILRTIGDSKALPEANTIETIAGRGIEAQFPEDTVLVGNRRLMEERRVGLDGDRKTTPADSVPTAPTDAAAGATIYVARNGRLLGTISVADPIREDARAAVAALHAGGVKRVVMLTGDSCSTAEAVAQQVGIDEVYAELLPEDKLTWIEQLRRDGFVTAMIGDGINDAPALAAADVGIAVGAAGTDIAIETADIALMRDDLRLAAQAVTTARKTLRNIRQNTVIAVTTVAALLAGVMFGEVHMAGGMLIHEASVMVVILNGMRLLRVPRTGR